MRTMLPTSLIFLLLIAVLCSTGAQTRLDWAGDADGQEAIPSEEVDPWALSGVQKSHVWPCPESLPASAQLHQTQPNTLTLFEIRPFVFVADQRSTSKILMGVNNASVDSISLDPSPMGGWFGSNPVILRDNGVEPDDRARDRIYTGELRLTNPPRPAFTSQIIRNLTFRLHRSNGSEQMVTEDVAAAIGVINTLRTLNVTTVRPNLFKTPHVVNIVQPNLLTSSYPLVGVDRITTAQLFYQHFPDDFDWLVFFHIYNNRGQPAGSYQRVKNAVQGIGQPLTDNTSAHGSGGRLRGIINLFFKNADPMSHEIFHTWGVYGFDAFGMVSSVGGFGHWGALANPTNSTVFGFPPTFRELTRNEAGNFCGPFGSGPMLGLELYLMGLAPASAIGANPYVVNASFVRFSCGGHEYMGTQLATLDQNRIISQFGLRVPAFPDQSQFRAAVIVVSNRPLEPAEWDYVTRVFEDHAQKFTGHYDGRAQISYHLGG